MATVTHYTSFCAAIQILLSGKIRLGNVQNSNDRQEREKVPPDASEYYFTFCTSEKNLDSLMWFSYAKNKLGACITFNLKPKKQKKSLLKKDEKLGRWFTKNVDYKDDNKNHQSDTTKWFIKNQIFKKEKEYRYLCISKEKIVEAEINWAIVDNVTLTVSDFFDKSIIDPIFKKAAVKVNINISIDF